MSCVNKVCITYMWTLLAVSSDTEELVSRAGISAIKLLQFRQEPDSPECPMVDRYDYASARGPECGGYRIH